ncbi:MAG: hypothetical protein ABJO01_14350 [Parasphingorhabdus sp.]|uniref:hypothetical protein n=1 Tax=Parasphingorhabdus sp. TaxID=2709688 RepID=UPI003299178B
MKFSVISSAVVGILVAIAPAAQAEVIISPRFSYYFDNSNLRVSELADNIRPDPAVDAERTAVIQTVDPDGFIKSRDEGSGRLTEQTTFPMVGGAITFVGDKNQFTFTAMAGSGNSTINTIFGSSSTLFAGDIAIDDVAILRANDRIDTDRYDVEFTWQRRLNEKFAIFGGLRYERLETGGPVTVSLRETNNIDVFIADILGTELPPQLVDARPTPQRLNTSSTLETFSLRTGVTAFVPVNQSLTAFFNGMAHASYQPNYTVTDTLFDVNQDVIGINQTSRSGEFSAGPDIAVGAQLLLTDNLSLDVRYRAIFFFPLSGSFSFSDARVNHGVNMGLSLRL